MEKIKVLYLQTRLVKNAGPINQAYNLVTAFKTIPEIDFQIACISEEYPGNSYEDKFTAAGIKVLRFAHKSYEIWKCVKDINKYIKENNINIVHSSGLRADLVNALLTKDVKHITTQRAEPINIYEGTNKLIAKICERVELFSIKKMDKVIACSKALANIISIDYGLHLEFVQNAVDTDYFSPITDEEKVNIRRRLDIPIDRRIILYAGSLIARKNIDYLVHAYKSSGCDALLVLIGDRDGAYENIYKKMNNDKVLFLGQQPPLDYVRCSDFTISASLSEGLPNSSLESMACGIPMILSDIGPHKELMEEYDMGVLYSTDNEENLKRALYDVMNKDYKTLVNNCLSAVENRFSKYQCAKNYMKKYQELV